MKRGADISYSQLYLHGRITCNYFKVETTQFYIDLVSENFCQLDLDVGF